MGATRVVVVSDTHLSLAAPEAEANWDAVIRYVDAVAPSLVVHVGDLSLDGTHNPDDLRYAYRQLDRLAVAWYAIPGNHDVGDNPWPGVPDDETVDVERLRRWLDIIGADHWSVTLDGWTLLAVNAQLFGSGLDAEAEQWSWLEQRVEEISPDEPVVLISHKPLAAAGQELADAPAYRFVPPSARIRLDELLHGRRLPLVVSGHVHQYRSLRLGDTDHVWAPTTWAVLPDETQARLGAKRCGVVLLELDPGTGAHQRFAQPDGIAQLTIGLDLANPYGH